MRPERRVRSGVEAAQGRPPHLQSLPTSNSEEATFPYMAPEQLEGKVVDMRADVFSFGAVLYEMATGKRAFAAQSKAGLIASVMTVTPVAPSKVVPGIPAIFDWVVEGCLKKNPGDRWQNIQDVRRALELPQFDWEQSAPVAKKGLQGWWIYAACVVGMIAATALFLAFRFSSVGQAKETLRFQIPAPANHTFLAMSSHGAAKISPDGSKIVFGAKGIGSPQQLWIRNMDSAFARPLEGTRGATYPFWSPDSKTIAFFDNDKLKSIPRAGRCEYSDLPNLDWPRRVMVREGRNPLFGGERVAATHQCCQRRRGRAGGGSWQKTS